MDEGVREYQDGLRDHGKNGKDNGSVNHKADCDECIYDYRIDRCGSARVDSECDNNGRLVSGSDKQYAGNEYNNFVERGHQYHGYMIRLHRLWCWHWYGNDMDRKKGFDSLFYG